MGRVIVCLELEIIEKRLTLETVHQIIRASSHI
jgi:hypothetical protein